ncbi:MAG: hypothetical protein AAGC60_11490 [Acidobacteriota bacterium]
MATLPAKVRRLFDGYEPTDLEAPDARDFVIERLLEAGEGDELAWLLREHVDEATARAWFERHGGRRLSRRSRAFWALALGTTVPEPPVLGAEIWDV